MASNLTTVDFLRELGRGDRRRQQQWGRRGCGGGHAGCGGVLHLGDACVSLGLVKHSLETLENKVQIVGVKLRDVTKQIVDVERRLRLANERHYYASAECLLLARLTALAGTVNVLLRYVIVLRYDRMKLEAIEETLNYTALARNSKQYFTNVLLTRLRQCDIMSERAQARLSDSAPPIDAICLANQYVDDEHHSIVGQLFAAFRIPEERDPDMMN